MKGYLLFILWFVSICLYSRDGAYVTQDKGVSTILFDTVIHDNTILEPFPPGISISSLVFSGEITLLTQSSLVRIILVDIHQHEYLIFETYSLLAGVSEISIDKAGEETSFLNNINPSGIKIEQIDAAVHLREILFSDKDASQKQIAVDVLKSQSQSKIDRINRHIQEARLKWVAGETSLSRMTYQEKKQMFGGSIPNLQGFEYYIGGVFVLPGTTSEDLASMNLKSAKSVPADSQFVSEFSWRNRHGQDWVTPVKYQGGCNSCWAFASVAATELLVNIYYNKQLDYDLSEQHLISCITGSCSQQGGYTDALSYIRDYGVVLEGCFPYLASELPCNDACNNPMESIQIENHSTHYSEEDKKKVIIRGAAGLNITDWSHLMQVVGFKTIKPGDSLFVRNSGIQSWITFEENHPLIGNTAWLCKNSWGTEWGDNGYVYIVGNDFNMPLYYLHAPVSSVLMDESNILCVDKDGDGFYSWGIGPKPSHCPECPDQPDGDDSEPCIGSMDEYGHFSPNPPRPIAKDTTVVYCSVIPDLYAEGTNIRWYSDEQLSNLVQSGNTFPTGHMEIGEYTYHATQTSPECGESKATEVTLSILIPFPQGQDTLIAEGETGILSVKGESNAVFNWYADRSLDTLLGQGVTFNTGITSVGKYTFYVTQTICSIESEPDTVILKIWNQDQLIFPDNAFENALIEQGVDTSDDGWISYAEAEATISLDVSGKGISNLTGIEAFTNLDTLVCSDNQLISLDVSNITGLVYLDCNRTQLANLNVSNNTSLAYLDCSRNPLRSLDVSYNTTLTSLICVYNQLTSLNVSNNPSLTYLDCSWNPLTTVNVSNNPLLTYLDCSRNLTKPQLTSLDISNNIALTYLDCSHNKLTGLDLTDNTALEFLICNRNHIEWLDLLSNIALKHLDCSENDLTSLDVTNNPSLAYLDCSSNLLTSLDLFINRSITSLIIRDMWTLAEVCVWTMPFPPANVEIDRSGSWSVDFKDCLNQAIPNGAFLHALIEEGVDLNGDSLISYEEAKAVHRLDVSNRGISDLTGIEAFVNLDTLNCNANQLTILDLTKNTALTSLSCEGNQLVTLNLANNTSLEQLDCSGNQLTGLIVLNCTDLDYLNCSGNQLYSLDVSRNDSLSSLIIKDMPTLHEVCVWTTPFPPPNVEIDTLGSPKVYFTTECIYGILYIPDISFWHSLIEYGVDTSGDGWISYAEAGSIKSLDVSDQRISDLTGIEAFTNLDTLVCSDNQLTSLDVSDNTSLKYLLCSWNPLNNLDVSNNTALTSLICEDIQLTNLDVSNNTALTSLICGYNPLTSLDVSDNVALTHLECPCIPITGLDLTNNLELEVLIVGAYYFPEWGYWYCDQYSPQLTTLDISKNIALKELYCADLQLTSLDVSKNAALTTLRCPENQLTSLDVSYNNALTFLDCENNQLTRLDFSSHPSLEDLNCSNNQLTRLDISNHPSLEDLNCSNNQLINLDVSNNPSLSHLNCSVNQLTSLDVSRNTGLTSLSCGGNQLTKLDVSKNPSLDGLGCGHNQLTSLDVSNNIELTQLWCGGNQLTSLDVSKNAELEFIGCGYNQLTSLDVSNCTGLWWLYCANNQLTSLDVSNCTELWWLNCSNNQLTSLDVSGCTNMKNLDCGSNSLTRLNLSNNSRIGGGCGWSNNYVSLSHMPALNEVCVWEMPFPPPSDCYNIDTTGSPNVYYTTDCSDYEAPELSATDTIYQSDFINVSSTENGMIYLVPEHTQKDLIIIQAASLDSVLAVANIPVYISLMGLENDVYWLYARDATGNLSELEAFILIGVGIENISVGEIKLYPNPANDLLTIESSLPGPLTIVITSMNGNLLYSKETIGPTHQINLSPFKDGLYFITIRSGDVVRTEKFIKF